MACQKYEEKRFLTRFENDDRVKTESFSNNWHENDAWDDFYTKKEGVSCQLSQKHQHLTLFEEKNRVNFLQKDEIWHD